jgi:hypothetical protein
MFPIDGVDSKLFNEDLMELVKELNQQKEEGKNI